MRQMDTWEYLDVVCDLLRQGKTYVNVPVTGGSMVPFLHSGDAVYLDPPPKRLRRGDIVLYTRQNGDYVLHRIRSVYPDGSLIVVGDAQQHLEPLRSARCVHGIVVSARHKDELITPKSPRWWFYRHIWLWLLPWRHRLMNLRSKK